MDLKKSMNRANSVVGQIKWWPLSSSSSTASSSSSVALTSTPPITPVKSLPSSSSIFSTSKTNKNSKNFASSSIAIHKLRESKWFRYDESRIFCAVVECGFIVEIKEGQENEPFYGVVNCKSTKDKKPKPENIEIFSIKINKDGRLKLIKMTLNDVWDQGCIIRINNFSDREKTPHSEKDIKDQIIFAQKAKQILWNNSQHFAHWCRYGDRQQDIRRKQISETMKWGTVGMNAGMILLMNRQKSNSMSK